MSQRNPMNARNSGDGPAGKTKKSASSAKPAKSAAGTVYVKHKPTTKKEIKAAEEAAREEKKALERKRAEKAWNEEQKRLKKEAAARGETFVEETLEEKEAREKEEAKARKKEARKLKKEAQKAQREQISKEEKMAAGKDMTAAEGADAYRKKKESATGTTPKKKNAQAKTREEAAAQRAAEIREAKVRKKRTNYQTWKMIFYMMMIMTLVFSVMAMLERAGTIHVTGDGGNAYSLSALVMMFIGLAVYFGLVRPAEKSMKTTETASFKTASAKERKHLAERQAEVDAKETEKQIKRLKWTSKLPGSKGKQARELQKAIEDIDAEFDAAEKAKAEKAAAKAGKVAAEGTAEETAQTTEG